MANTSFLQLPVATTLNGSDVVPINQNAKDARTTVSAIASSIPTGTVNNGQLANASPLSIKANTGASPGPVTDASISQVLDALLSSTQGVIIYRGLNTWTTLAPGALGQVLQTQGPAANPQWVAVGGVGTVVQVNTGAGLSGGPITSSGTLSSIEQVNAQTGVSYPIVLADQAKLITFNNAGAVAVTIPSAATLGSGFWCDVQNIGAGAVTITPTTSTINLGATLGLATATGCRIVSDGTNYSIQGGRSTGAITLTGDVTGSGSGSIATTVAKIDGFAVTLAGTLTTVGAFGTTLTTTGTTSLTLPTSGTVTAQGNTVTGSGSIVLATSPTLVTPTIGVATATTVNKVTLTAPATGSTLTIADGKTATVSNTLTFTGTDSSSVAFSTGGTVAYTNVTTLSSLVSVGTLTTGTWNATVINPTYGGTGVNNGASTLTMAGNVTHSGAFTTTFTVTNTTSVTLPTAGTLATLAGSETFTNKTLTSPIVNSGTLNTPDLRNQYVAKTANYTAVATTDTYINCTTNAFTLTLPTAVGITGKSFVVKNSNTVASGKQIAIATTSAQTIDTNASDVVLPLSSRTYTSDGANYAIS